MTGRPNAVHQFHAGTAEGDAVTQQMLSIRERLRGLGYRSEIFALHIPPTLADRIRHLDTYRGSADQVLLLYHSIGNEALDRLGRLPDRKILNYENITPEEFFDSELVRRAIRLGRRQLKLLPDIVDTAIANSNYSRRELLACGFDRAEVLPVQTRFDRYARWRGSRPRTRDWLSVGRVVGNKCQHDIIAAFGVYANAFDSEARLHLIGDISDRAYLAELQELAEEMNVSRRVGLLGKTSEHDLIEAYATAGVYVSLSEHEGFGVPLLEAMTAGLPVIAFAATAVPETLAGAGVQIHTKDPWFLAGLVKTILDDDGLRQRIVDRQDARVTQLARFDVDAVLERSIQAALGAKHPLQIQIQGPFETSYSLAVLNRQLALALDRLDGIEVSIYATEGPGDYTPDPADLRQNPDAARLNARSAMVPYPDVTIRQLHPPRLADAPGGLRCLYFGWEESRLPSDYVQSFNEHLDGIGVMSAYVRDLLRASGVTIPIGVTGVGVEAPRTGGPLPPRVRDRKSFVFLHVSSAFPRKAVDVLLRAYFETFNGGDDVSLVLKTFPNPHNDVGALLAEARHGHPDPPHVCWIDEDLPRAQVDSLYGIADCYVHPARGEGFGLPVAEAMLAGVPVITVEHSGLAEFCSDETALIVRHRLEPARTHLTVAGSSWAEPEVEHLAEQMRTAYERADTEAVRGRVAAAKASIEERFSWDAVALRWRDFIDELRTGARTIEVSLVSPWNSRCGIAEYSRQLVAALAGRAQVDVFADRDVELIDMNAEERTSRVWKDRWHPDLTDLIEGVFASPSELVHVQFNFGFFELGALAAFIDAMLPLKAVVVTFHATVDTVIDGQLVSLGGISNVLARADLLIAHQPSDVDRLRSFGLADNVVLIPQGAPGPPPVTRAQARDALRLGERPTVATFGFLLPHKGTLELLQAVDLVRAELPDVLLLAPCATHPDPSSARYREACEREITARGLERTVTLITDFLRNEEVRTILAAADVIVLPYTETTESSSAALRFVLGIGAPIITTRIPIFEDVTDVVRQTGTAAPEELAAAILDVLRSPEVASDLATKASDRAEELSWARAAQAHLDAYRTILPRRRPSRH